MAKPIIAIIAPGEMGSGVALCGARTLCLRLRRVKAGAQVALNGVATCGTAR